MCDWKGPGIRLRYGASISARVARCDLGPAYVCVCVCTCVYVRRDASALAGVQVSEDVRSFPPRFVVLARARGGCLALLGEASN